MPHMSTPDEKHKPGEREREREKDRERGREGERERERYRERDSERKRETARARVSEKDEREKGTGKRERVGGWGGEYESEDAKHGPAGGHGPIFLARQRKCAHPALPQFENL